MRHSDPRRILHIFGCMNRGGAETRALEIMRHVDRPAFEFHFCTLTGRPGTLDGDIERAGGTVHPLALGLRFPGRFRHLLRTHEFTAVHAHVQLFSGWLLRLAHREGVPIRIAHFHSSRDNHRGGLRRNCQRRLMRYLIDRHATDIVAVSAATLAGAWDRDWQKDPRCRVIYTAIDTERFRIDVDRAAVRRELGYPEDGTIVLHIGSQQEAKNHPRVIEVFAALAHRDRDARLLLIGRADPLIEPRLRNRAGELGVLDRVTFAGERRDVPRLMKAADVMVFPSLWEGLPGSVLEARAAGLPVIATDAPFMHEIAATCRDIRCVPLTSSDDEWVAAAQELIRARRTAGASEAAGADDSPWFSMGRYAREWAQVWTGA